MAAIKTATTKRPKKTSYRRSGSSSLVGNIASVDGGRPIPISLMKIGKVDVQKIGGTEEVNLATIAKTLNDLQGVFRYKALKDPIYLGDYDDKRGYLDETIYKGMRTRLSTEPSNYGIAILQSELNASSFNRHDRNNHTEKISVGVITTKGYKAYLPVGKNLTQYLAYLILCESFCVTSRQHIEHVGVYYCLFDECIDKDQFTRCLESPKIHSNEDGDVNGCFERLISYGFSEQDLRGVDPVLEFVRKKKFLVFILNLSDLRIFNYYVGLAISLFTGLFARQYPDYALVLLGILAGVFLLSIPFKFLYPGATYS